jgi:predicted nucleotidyltransferase
MSDKCADAVVAGILEALRAWAARTDAIGELWLIGSRAKGKARPDSDVDLAIKFSPVPVETWRAWKSELKTIGGPYDIRLTGINDEIDVACLLWSREAPG